MLVTARGHAALHRVALHRVFARRVPRVVASDAVDGVLSGLRQHDHQSVRLCVHEQQLQAGFLSLQVALSLLRHFNSYHLVR